MPGHGRELKPPGVFAHADARFTSAEARWQSPRLAQIRDDRLRQPTLTHAAVSSRQRGCQLGSARCLKTQVDAECLVEFGHEAGGQLANPFANALDGYGSDLLGLRLGG